MTASAIAFAASCPRIRSCTGAVPALPGDLRNLLQVAASAIHLIDSQVGDDLRPLVRIGLAAIQHAAGNIPTPGATFHAAERIS